MQMPSSSLTLNEQKTKSSPIQALQEWLVNQLAEQLSLDTQSISVTEPLTRYGLDSIDAVTLVGDLEDWLELELPDTLFWDYPTIGKATQYLAENFDISSGLTQLKVEEVKSPSAELVTPPSQETPKSTSQGKTALGGLWGRLTGS